MQKIVEQCQIAESDEADKKVRTSNGIHHNENLSYIYGNLGCQRDDLLNSRNITIV